MNGRAIVTELRNQLAKIYETEADARRITGDAGLAKERIAFGGSAITIWTAILQETAKTNQMDLLLDVVLGEYGRHAGLQQAYTNYRQFISTSGNLLAAIDSIRNDASPFKGLEYFREEDARLFFGREVLTAELTNDLRHNRFLAIVGESGSGKSSLVRAGLIPALKKATLLADHEFLPGSNRLWPIHIITPTARPLRELAKTLTINASDATTLSLMEDLGKDNKTLDVRVSKLLDSHVTSQRLLLVIDQFEELFTLCRNEMDRSAFINNILYASSVEGVLTVVLTLRLDFYHKCAQFEELFSHLQQHKKFIEPMNDADLRRAIELPAQHADLEFEPGLVTILLDDVRNEPGALPLLSHALHETWKRRNGRLLTIKEYNDAGRVSGAIAATAERVYNEGREKPNWQEIARNILVRLTALGEDVQDTHRRVALQEFKFEQWPDEEVEKVLNSLANARLIIMQGQEAELIHDALITEWPRLQGWLHNARPVLVEHQRLTEAVTTWLANDRDSRRLLRDESLAQAKALMDPLYQNNLNIDEKMFLRKSREYERRRRYRRVSDLALIGAIFLIIIVTTFIATGAEFNRVLIGAIILLITIVTVFWMSR